MRLPCPPVDIGCFRCRPTYIAEPGNTRVRWEGEARGTLRSELINRIPYHTIVPALPYSSLRWKLATDGAKDSANVNATASHSSGLEKPRRRMLSLDSSTSRVLLS